MIDFVPKAGLIASISGVATNFQWEINVVGSVAVYLYFIDIPQNLGFLQTSILPLFGLLRNIKTYLIESIELIGVVFHIIWNIKPMVE